MQALFQAVRLEGWHDGLSASKIASRLARRHAFILASYQDRLLVG
jgi:hypothetical protein